MTGHERTPLLLSINGDSLHEEGDMLRRFQKRVPVSMKICWPKARAGITDAKNIYVAGAKSLHSPSQLSFSLLLTALHASQKYSGRDLRMLSCLRPVFAPHVQSSRYHDSLPKTSCSMPRPMPKLFMQLSSERLSSLCAKDIEMQRPTPSQACLVKVLIRYPFGTKAWRKTNMPTELIVYVALRKVNEGAGSKELL